MKLIIYFSAIFSVILFSYEETEVSAQGIQPLYGGGPIAFSQDSDDDDIGLLLTVLLLATRNRGNSGCCGCCNCGGNNIPIPYPIPIPTNNPIINISKKDNEGETGCASQPVEEIHVITEHTSNLEADTHSTANSDNNGENEAIAESVAVAEAENNG